MGVIVIDEVCVCDGVIDSVEVGVRVIVGTVGVTEKVAVVVAAVV